MIENQQKPRHGWSKVSLWLVVIVIVIVSTLVLYYTGSNKSGGTTPSPTVPAEPLQLGQLKPHIFEDMGFSVDYPSDWEEWQSDNPNPVTIESKERCCNISLLTSVFMPYTVNSNGFEASVDDTVSFLVQIGESTIVQKQSVTYDGSPLVEVILSDNSSLDYEIWNVLVFFLSDDESKYSVTVSYCILDCWEYYKDAVYTITSTYRFLD